MYTPWGYTIKLDSSDMPPILGVSEFRTLTGNRLSSTDSAVLARLEVVSAIVRDWCGWHVSPSVSCTCDLDGASRFLWIPCMGVRSIESVDIAGEAISEFEWSPRGELMLYRCPPARLGCVHVAYTAGYDQHNMGALAQVVCQLTENALVATPGLREEHVGGVGATFNQTESGVSGGVRLLASDRALLAPYRIMTM